MHVQVAVVGRGMIGAAAARHLAESGTSTALIGPLEPTDRRASVGPFSSHPDEGRVTRVFGRTPIWATVAARSLSRHADIEVRSGIRFYTRSGCAVVFPDAHTWIDAAEGLDNDAKMVSEDWLHQRFGIVAPAGNEIAWEASPAGHINPRRLVAAQASLAASAGAQLIEFAAERVVRAGATLEVSGSWGSLTADRILVATGAFAGSLLPRPLALDRRRRTVLMAEMEAADIPCLISEAPDDRLHEIYWVPPVPFPFGKTCLKIGGDMKNAVAVEEGDLIDWFHTDGAPDEIDALENSLRAMLPSANIASMTTSPCVITRTPSGYPHIGWVDDGIAVAIGGNGSAAKSSDELGRLAATLFSDAGWTDELDAALFEPEFA